MVDGATRRSGRPEGSGLAQVGDGVHEGVTMEPGRHVVGVEAPSEVANRKQLDQLVKGEDALAGSGGELRPPASVFFRPEEVHGASGKGQLPSPLAERHGDMANDRVGFGGDDGAIPHLDMHRFTAVEARCINSYQFPRCEPADRQRFETSLAEPAVLVVNGDAVLGREVAERGK